MLSKKQVAIALSKLQKFKKNSFKLEQHETPSEIAADFLYTIDFTFTSFEDKHILDAGCGTGFLGIGALLLGAKKVTFLEIDESAIEVLKENLKQIEDEYDEEFNYEIILSDIKDFKNNYECEEDFDICITNPPFGTKIKNIDRVFLETAMKFSKETYSFHKTTTMDFFNRWASQNNYTCQRVRDYDFELWATQSHHKRKIHRIKVSTIRVTK